MIMSATLAVVVLLSACAQPQMSMGPPQQPDPAAEMAVLAKFVGHWTGTAEMVSPSPEELKAMMPEGADPPASTFKGDMNFEMTLGGQFLSGHGWHEMGEGQRITYHEYWRWDPKAKKFRSWFFSDWGEHGSGFMIADDAGTSFEMTAIGVDSSGSKTSGRGTMTFPDNDTLEWTWSETGAHGAMEFKGVSRRK